MALRALNKSFLTWCESPGRNPSPGEAMDAANLEVFRSGDHTINISSVQSYLINCIDLCQRFVL